MADSLQSLKPLRNHSVDLLLPHLFYVRHNFLLVHTLFSHFFFSSSHCSSVALHSDPLVLFPVPLLLNSLPGDLRPLDELYAQKLKYKAISEELDHALNDMTSL